MAYAVYIRDNHTHGGYSGRVVTLRRTREAADVAMAAHQHGMVGESQPNHYVPLSIARLKEGVAGYRDGDLLLTTDIDHGAF